MHHACDFFSRVDSGVPWILHGNYMPAVDTEREFESPYLAHDPSHASLNDNDERYWRCSLETSTENSRTFREPLSDGGWGSVWDTSVTRNIGIGIPVFPLSEPEGDSWGPISWKTGTCTVDTECLLFALCCELSLRGPWLWIWLLLCTDSLETCRERAFSIPAVSRELGRAPLADFRLAWMATSRKGTWPGPKVTMYRKLMNFQAGIQWTGIGAHVALEAHYCWSLVRHRNFQKLEPFFQAPLRMWKYTQYELSFRLS